MSIRHHKPHKTPFQGIRYDSDVEDLTDKELVRQEQLGREWLARTPLPVDQDKDPADDE